MKKLILTLALFLAFNPSFAAEQKKIKAVASFSILADIVQNIGGEKLEVISLVDPDSDAHVFEPRPFHAKIISDADVVFVNGLGFEGWINRLVEQSGYKKQVVEVSKGVKPIETSGEHHHGHSHSNHEHEHRAHENSGENSDPHIWHDVRNAVKISENITQALIEADKENAEYYKKNAAAYIEKLKQLDAEVRKELAKIPAAERKVITSHDAFGYYAKAYDVKFIAPQGISTESEASAKDVAKIVDEIKKNKVKAVFVENIADKKLLEQITKEAGIKIFGKLYSDALSQENNKANNYISLIKHNTDALVKAMQQ